MSDVHQVINNHVIPTEDEQEHIPFDWCECGPVERFHPEDGIIWIHRPFDMRHLIEQADTIRKITSLDLWTQEDERSPKRMVSVIPFEHEAELIWPTPAKK